VVRPHGLRGHVVVELWTNRLERLKVGSLLRTPDGELRVEHASHLGAGSGDRWLVAFAGIDDHDRAEALRDTVLRADPIPDADAYWVHELIGARVVDGSGVDIGVVESVEANPASDLLVLADGRLIPLHFVTDRAPGRLTVEVPEGLLEL
jgi:16S rRNA processing protein RimM